MATLRPHGHGRMRKRGSSASSVAATLSPSQLAFSHNDSPSIAYEPWSSTTDSPRPMLATQSSYPLKIKPYLRKLSAKDNDSLDLSRPAAENDQLAGLGISEYDDFTRSVSEVSFAPVKYGRTRHARSTSTNSQFSTSPNLHRPTAPYLTAVRHTPRPYTPPTAQSPPPSALGTEAEIDDILADEDARRRLHALGSAHRSGSQSSTPGAASALLIHTSGSSTRLAGTYSQSSVSLSSPMAHTRSRGDTLRSMDTATSPSTRTSFDKPLGVIRGGRDSPAEAASRAASIRAARQAFQEKEEAKVRKYDQEAHKQAEREVRKQTKKVEYERRKSASQEKKRARSMSDHRHEQSVRPSIGGRQYSDHRRAHTSTLPHPVTSVTNEKQGSFVPEVTRSREAKGRWLRFVAWFKTRLLRMSTRVHVSS